MTGVADSSSWLSRARETGPDRPHHDREDAAVERELVRLVNAGGVACTVRDTRGQEIAAAWGQLAAEG